MAVVVSGSGAGSEKPEPEASRRAGGAAAPSGPTADGTPPALLEHLPETVTEEEEEFGGIELAACRCDCWFCPDCCGIKGYKLRARLIPILRTFRGLLMLTFTVDPLLFPDPRTTYLYMRERRCLGRTLQDLDRAKCLHSRRYFYVLEFQRRTEQAHFHVLVDASFIPFGLLLASWSKHRPAHAGPVAGDRPPFGTVLFSKGDFDNPAHAARYATKYLIKVPADGFPAWVMAMGRNKRLKRYGTSHGFWAEPGKRSRKSGATREVRFRSYAERCGECGSALNVFELKPVVDFSTGELQEQYRWRGRLALPASILDLLRDSGNPKRRRRRLPGGIGAAMEVLEMATGEPPRWIGKPIELEREGGR